MQRRVLEHPELSSGVILVRWREATAGLGNRLPPLVTGCLVAMLTNKALMLDLQEGQDLLEYAFDLDWRLHSAQLQSTLGEPVHLPKGWDFWLQQDMADLQGGILALSDHLDYNVPLLRVNPHHSARIRSWFPDGQVFHHVSRRLFKLNFNMQTLADQFMQQHFTAVTVGLHQRAMKIFSAIDILESERFVAAALSAAESLGNVGQAKFFVAADTTAGAEQLSSLLPPGQIVRNNLWDIDASRTLGGNPGTAEGAVLDMYLLSQCREIIVTSGSSFGYVAAGWGGVKPYYVTWARPNATPFYEQLFWGSTTSEPCFFSGSNLLSDGPPDLVALFKTNPDWMQHTQCHPYHL